jgi:hypothetical protein
MGGWASRSKFSVIGAMLALYAWSKDTKKNVLFPERRSNIQEPTIMESPRLIAFLAVMLVPLTYFGLWVYAGVPICFAVWISIIFIADFVVLPMYSWIFLLIVDLFCLVCAIRVVGMTIFQIQAFQPALRVNFSEYRTPQLFAVFQEICQAIQYRLPVRVILHAEPRIFVVHGKLNIFDGMIRGTILAIGLPLLRTLTRDELKALMAHEFLLFKGDEALYTRYVLPLYRTFDNAIRYYDNMMEKSQAETDIIPVMRIFNFPQDLFLNVYHVIYAIMDRYLGCERQLRADRQAAQCFGANHFVAGLKKSYDLAMSFESICYKLPFSEENFFERIQRVYVSLQEDGGAQRPPQAGDIDGHRDHIPTPGSRITALIPLNVRLDRLEGMNPFPTDQRTSDTILEEVHPVEVRLSLIYQYFRDIKRYYNELQKALKQYHPNPFLAGVSKNIAVFLRKFLKK